MPGYEGFCPVSMAAEVLGRRWTLLNVHELLSGSNRFNDIPRGVPRLSPSVLSQRLQSSRLARSCGPRSSSSASGASVGSGAPTTTSGWTRAS